MIWNSKSDQFDLRKVVKYPMKLPFIVGNLFE